MFFGLTNSPAMFQAFMNNILKDFIDEGWCVVYMDDILIFSDKVNIHWLHMRHVLEQLRENDLYLKPEKCEFEVTRTLFLGMVITPGHILMEEMKLAGIKDWEAPKTVKDGETERVNQEVEIYLRFFCTKEQTKWKDLLHFAEFAHNARTHSTTHESPFYLTMGYYLRPLPTIFDTSTVPLVEQRLAELKRLREETSALLDIMARKVKERSGRTFDKFEKGQKVWLEGKNLLLGYLSPKLFLKREGPFEIEEVLGPVTYKLKLPF
ncbi:hypothetical protein Moror_668 [Moniliophthora roreri MCA 2997]|uniref:Reverse transcriptase domain-containing protein n=1 Tax=Moniliophthora roreri (strain MCA 2997) TaxID=1381753 RepID=V2XR39_MONRO|nr:hypothetical protein Moror_668 [Moniliophthora roreri MCA 2997]